MSHTPTSIHSRRWSIAHKKLPKEEVIYFCQVIVIYTIVIVSLINLSIGSTQNPLWASLLSGSVGYLLPSPRISDKKNVALLPDAAE